MSRAKAQLPSDQPARPMPPHPGAGGSYVFDEEAWEFRRAVEQTPDVAKEEPAQ